MDDNIRCFYRLNRNRKIPIGDGTVFRVAEDFIERFENVAKAGFNYEMFVKRKSTWPPFYLNTRVYSCILLDNARYDEFPWRGRYNEDTDLSLRLLKAGYCTILFNAFLADKIGTMRMKGGNTDELYVDDGRLQMAQSLVDQHPDIARVSFKWNRPQHHVDYRPFKYNRLLLRKGLVLPTGTNNYGMRLEECVDGAGAHARPVSHCRGASGAGGLRGCH
jgi:hypothetical protein